MVQNTLNRPAVCLVTCHYYYTGFLGCKISVRTEDNYSFLAPFLAHPAGIAERVSVLDWLSLRCAAIIALRVSNLGLCP